MTHSLNSINLYCKVPPNGNICNEQASQTCKACWPIHTSPSQCDKPYCSHACKPKSGSHTVQELYVILNLKERQTHVMRVQVCILLIHKWQKYTLKKPMCFRSQTIPLPQGCNIYHNIYWTVDTMINVKALRKRDYLTSKMH